MTIQDVTQLVKLFDTSSASSMHLQDGAFTLTLERTLTQNAPVAPVVAVVTPSVEAESPTITAPLVGTFYAAAAPEQPPFVTVGQQVSKGETVCLIEAMKMMSEVVAPCDCIIEDICQENGALLSFGAPLFTYRQV